jgi:GTPase
MSTAPEQAVAAVSPAAKAQPQLLRFATAGSVDDGKSTLIGRLL